MLEIVGNQRKREHETGPDEIVLGSAPDRFVPGGVQELVPGRGETLQDSEGETAPPFLRRDHGVDEAGLTHQTDVINDFGIAAGKDGILPLEQEIAYEIEIVCH